jgi:hypothetical protein
MASVSRHPAASMPSHGGPVSLSGAHLNHHQAGAEAAVPSPPRDATPPHVFDDTPKRAATAMTLSQTSVKACCRLDLDAIEPTHRCFR